MLLCEKKMGEGRVVRARVCEDETALCVTNEWKVAKKKSFVAQLVW